MTKGYLDGPGAIGKSSTLALAGTIDDPSGLLPVEAGAAQPPIDGGGTLHHPRPHGTPVSSDPPLCFHRKQTTFSRQSAATKSDLAGCAEKTQPQLECCGMPPLRRGNMSPGAKPVSSLRVDRVEPYMTRLITGRNWHGQIAADGSRQKFLDFVVPENRFLAPGLRVAPDGMAGALANRQATVLLKMTQQGLPLHASTSSVVSAWGSSRKTSSRSMSSSSWMASLRLPRHSSLVSP